MVSGKINYNSFSVIGAARSGVAAAKLLKSLGYKVFLSDSGSEKNINMNFLNEIKKYEIEFEFGGHSNKVYQNNLIVVSPGVPQNSEVIKNAFVRRIDVVSEIEMASWFCKGKIVSVTGTNGKTTTTTLIGKILEDAGIKNFICGNIGTAFSDVVGLIGDNDVAVLETSSFQLDNIKYFKPYVSVLLNVTPDHLDRYENSFDNYIQSKMRVFENQNGNDCLIYNYDDEIIREKVSGIDKTKLIPFSIKIDMSNNFPPSPRGAFMSNGEIVFLKDNNCENIINRNKLNIKGEHNIYNVLASVITAKIFGIKTESVSKTLADFKGVEHRLEFVREFNGVKFYNDSKATNVNSVWYALQGFDEPLVLILGGRDKGNNYSLIENEVKKYVKHIVAVGESKNKIYDYFKNITPISVAEDFKDAFNKAVANSIKGDVVLLSPACSSFDMFENFEHRGNEFKKLVKQL